MMENNKTFCCPYWSPGQEPEEPDTYPAYCAMLGKEITRDDGKHFECHGCYFLNQDEESGYGSVNVRMNILKKIVEKAKKQYEHSLGGNLHIVLDDENICDDHVLSCLRFALDDGDREGAELAGEILRLSLVERRILVYDLYDEYSG